MVSILPRLATGIKENDILTAADLFLFFPVLRRGSAADLAKISYMTFLFFPVLRRGSVPACTLLLICVFLFFPVLRRGSRRDQDKFAVISFYSSPSCDGDRTLTGVSGIGLFLFFPVLRRGS